MKGIRNTWNNNNVAQNFKKTGFLLIVVLGTFTGQVFASNAKMADEQNLQVYLEQVIGQGKARNYKKP